MGAKHDMYKVRIVVFRLTLSSSTFFGKTVTVNHAVNVYGVSGEFLLVDWMREILCEICKQKFNKFNEQAYRTDCFSF